jgi:hypothetical protein
MNRQQLADKRSKALHAKIALKLRTNPHLWKIPRQNIQRWGNKMGGLPPALYEWNHILETSSKEDILSILESESEEAKRLRSSSPFTGILNDSERMEILQSFQNQN